MLIGTTTLDANSYIREKDEEFRQSKDINWWDYTRKTFYLRILANSKRNFEPNA